MLICHLTSEFQKIKILRVETHLQMVDCCSSIHFVFKLIRCLKVVFIPYFSLLFLLDWRNTFKPSYNQYQS